MRMRRKAALFVITLIIAFGTWFYLTPYIAVYGMKSAAEARDAARLSGYVNFPALRSSLKATFHAKLVSNARKNRNNGFFGALGSALAVAFVNPVIEALYINPMIDSYVRPESLARMMKGEKPQSAKGKAQSTPAEPDYSMAYESFDRFVVNVKKKGSTKKPVGLVFRREGLFSWKLSALRLPM
jgi:Protein of unknown function (DUF2939)